MKEKARSPQKPSKKYEKARKKDSIWRLERMKVSGLASSATAKSKHPQKPTFIDKSEEDDTDEMLDFTPLQVRYPDSKR